MSAPPSADAQSKFDSAPDANALAEAAVLQEIVARLIRKNNMAIFLIVVTGLAAVAIVETQGLFPQLPPYMWLLTTLRIVLPIVAMILTGVTTNGVIQRYLNDRRGKPITPLSIAAAFFLAKAASIRFLLLAGLFGSACLIFGHRTLDVILAVIPLVLLIVTRVNSQGPFVFARFVATQRASEE